MLNDFTSLECFHTLVVWLTGMIAKKFGTVEVMHDGKQSILAWRLLRIDYVTISRPKRNYNLTKQILEVVISKWQSVHQRTVICFPEGSQYTGLVQKTDWELIQILLFLVLASSVFQGKLLSQAPFLLFLFHIQWYSENCNIHCRSADQIYWQCDIYIIKLHS